VIIYPIGWLFNEVIKQRGPTFFVRADFVARSLFQLPTRNSKVVIFGNETSVGRCSRSLLKSSSEGIDCIEDKAHVISCEFISRRAISVRSKRSALRVSVTR